MTLGGFIVLLIVAAIVGAVAEALAGVKVGAGWVGTIIVGLIGAWVGSVLFRIGPLIGGVYLISAILGSFVLVLLLKMISARRAA